MDGHAFRNSFFRNQIKALVKEICEETLGKGANPKIKDKKIQKIYSKKAKDADTSLYALFDEGEFIAESMVQYLENRDLNSAAQKVLELLKRKGG